MPTIKCIIVSELLDHNLPTPSIIVDASEKIQINVIKFRSRGILSLTKTGRSVDTVLVTDGTSVTPSCLEIKY